MPAPTDKFTLEQDSKGRWRVRVRIGQRGRHRIVLGALGKQAAERRAALVVELARYIHDRHDALLLLREAAAHTTSEAALLKAIASAEKSAARPDCKVETVRSVGDRWASGDLHRQYPDHVRKRRSAVKYLPRLYPVIGDIPIAKVTLADCDAAMASLPAGLSSGSRRLFACELQTVMSYAVYPLRLREASPIPKGWVPKHNRGTAYAWLYPSEDAKLMACAAIPLARRVLWGLLVREGMRYSEALALTKDCIDFERGALRLDANKTDDPRAWALSPGVAAALAKCWPLPKGLPAQPAEQLRADLLVAGVDRHELHARTATRRPLRAHDLRGSFVTIALANGATEAWVMDRTGHRTSQMLGKYRRAARHAGELGLGTWAPLDVALGLAKPGPASGPRAPKKTKLTTRKRTVKPEADSDYSW